MDNIAWFEKWYANETYKNYGKKIEINISTIENSAWRIKINLKNTSFIKKDIEKDENFKSKYNWYKAKIKKNEFIAEGDFTKLSFLIGKFRSLIGESKSSHHRKSDYFFNNEIQEFILEDKDECYIFLHYTNTKKTASKILKTGLKFSYSFDKTTKKVKSSSVDLNYNHYVLKQFGENVIVIGISNKIYKKYLNLLKNSNNNDLVVEEVLTELPVTLNDDSEKVYTLHNKFIKGYFNYRENKIIKNKNYNPSFDSKKFKENINNFN